MGPSRSRGCFPASRFHLLLLPHLQVVVAEAVEVGAAEVVVLLVQVEQRLLRVLLQRARLPGKLRAAVAVVEVEEEVEAGALRRRLHLQLQFNSSICD